MTRPPPPYPAPPPPRERRRRRGRTRRTHRRRLGAVPPRPGRVRATLRDRHVERDYVREDLVLDDGCGGRIPAALVLPRGARPPHPAVLYHHSHFGDYAVGLGEL